MQNSHINVRFAERITTKNRKPFDTGGRTPRDFPNRTVRKGVSFWNVFGGPSRGVRQVLWSRTIVFEKDASRAQKTISRFVFQESSQRCNSLHEQHVTSSGTPKQKTLSPHGATARSVDSVGPVSAELVNPSIRIIVLEFERSRNSVDKRTPLAYCPVGRR
jgi:hypothetical protein